MSAIIIILLVLVACVAALTIIQKREQEKAAIRQKIAQYRYRANNASAILSNFSQLPIGPEARLVLLRYCLANLRAIKGLSPSDPNIVKQIESVEHSLKNPGAPADKQRLSIPNDMTLLTRQVNQLSNLAKLILKINKSNLADPNIVSVAVRRVMGLISESKICAYIQQGKEHLSRHEYVPAQRSFIMAQQMMLKIPEKNDRLKKLEQELVQLITSSPADAANKELSFNEESKGEEEHDNLFGPRKKW